MERRRFLSLAAGSVALPGLPHATHVPRVTSATAAAPELVHPGVWRLTLGTPERITPVSTRRVPPAAGALGTLPAAGAPPVTAVGEATPRGYVVRLPLAPNELVYGLGLQFQSFIQRGLKKMLRVNADPVVDSGDSHAPVPFYVTTRGYGVLLDTARYATVYAGNKRRKGDPPTGDAGTDLTADALPSAYARYRFQDPSEVIVEIPRAAGVDVYLFGGPTMRLAVQRYNLFAGGGALPPRWGLGVWYRCERDFAQRDVERLAAEFRERAMPCDVLGLEPGWQTHAYSCSYAWSDRFPDPRAMLAGLARSHYRVNLWEHAFVHPSSPIHAATTPHAGDYLVWDGLVPDFLDAEARRVFADFHEREHIALGVSGYKLDECDNSDFTRNWSFPELARFPSGADGEQMHALFGLRYQDTVQSIFERRGMRTYGLARNSGALAAPYPYVLYSDLYDHATFVRAVAKAGLTGLLWTPEVRDARTPEELVRRLQAAVLSPMALVNAWYIRNPPWKQVDREANNAGRFAEGWEAVEATCRAALELRMRLVPYLHAAFVRYRREGLPPFRPLVLDHPDDVHAWPVDDAYLIGDALLAAPVVAGESTRTVYLPAGDWYDYWTHERIAGGRRIDVAPPLERVPLFVRAGALLPLAQPTLHTDDPRSGELTVLAFGAARATCTLYEDDGAHPAGLTEVTLSWDGRAGSVRRAGPERAPGYRVVSWTPIA
ncbi:glycoside hydrolase family 31 [Gemmatirosa kalamazoonensis]|uniref:Glycoside hydrolase family 31 n=1 Tax=Gemmatirosa kalamazoonensis TaxID=861299 RepID=W0RCT6_9BACT|nr:TIM-barrel domain-containing protein [Gemmatirosa kalamazoonensis]AHG88616.1 glycoside hydrolase family 31 [Gemmatirosa kalamazoonensis]